MRICGGWWDSGGSLVTEGGMSVQLHMVRVTKYEFPAAIEGAR